MRRNFPHIQAGAKNSNAVESSNFIYKISKNQFIRRNINVEHNVMCERPCVMIVGILNLQNLLDSFLGENILIKLVISGLKSGWNGHLVSHFSAENRYYDS